MRLANTLAWTLGALALLALAGCSAKAPEEARSPVCPPPFEWEVNPADAQTLRCTPEHPFYVVGRGWVAAEDLRVGDRGLDAEGNEVVFTAIESRQEEAAHYNFEVEDFHTYFVSETADDPGVWVHNRCFDPMLGGFKKGISADEIRSINRGFGGTSEFRSAQTALANAANVQGFWNKAAVIVRDISGSHLFNNGNKRTALAVVNELMRRNNVFSGTSPKRIREVVGDVASRKLTDVREIALALRGS